MVSQNLLNPNRQAENRYTTGRIKIVLSTRSISPPCPGIRFPKSFTPKMPLDHGCRQIPELAEHAQRRPQNRVPPEADPVISHDERNGHHAHNAADKPAYRALNRFLG